MEIFKLTKGLFLSSLFLALAACNNKAEVPAEVKVNIPETTQTVNVIHTIDMSIQMTEFFKESCTQQIDAQQPPLPEPARSQAIDACVITTSQEFINTFMQLINQQMQQQQGAQ